MDRRDAQTAVQQAGHNLGGGGGQGGGGGGYQVALPPHQGDKRVWKGDWLNRAFTKGQVHERFDELDWEFLEDRRHPSVCFYRGGKTRIDSANTAYSEWSYELYSH